MRRDQLLRAAAAVLGAAVGLYLIWRFLLPILLPFLLALLAARAVQTPVRQLEQRTAMPRWLAAGLMVLALFLLLGLALFCLCRAVGDELARLSRELPALLQSLAQPAAALRDWSFGLLDKLPDFLHETLEESINSLFRSGSTLLEKLYGKVFSFASGVLSSLPDLLLFLVTMVLASFMIASQYDAILLFLSRRLPAAWKRRLGALAQSLRRTLAAWLQAQLKLIGINFLLLTMGLMLLNVEFPLLVGALAALIDALPVFGTGTVLIPWALFCFLRGNVRRGVGLLVLYAAAYLTRATLEPRLVGKQMGLHPLWTLLALYAGYRLMGVGGMILFPIAAIFLKQLWDHLSPPHPSSPAA